jgi:hypothetical protein
MARTELEEKIVDFAVDEGILGRKIPQEKGSNLEFGYEINFPPNSPNPMKIVVLKVNDRKALALQLATQIAPPHVEALKKGGKANLFFTIFKRYMLTQNLLYNIDVQNFRYIISDTIYPDGLTQNYFYLIIRKIFNSSLYINMALMDVLEGTGGSGKKDSISDDLNYLGGGSMYT